jgi:hypothetical protein
MAGKMQDNSTLFVQDVEQFEQLHEPEPPKQTRASWRRLFLCPECENESVITSTTTRPNGNYIYYRQCKTCDYRFKTIVKRDCEELEETQPSDPKVYRAFASYHWFAISDSHLDKKTRLAVLASLKRVKKELRISEAFTFKAIIDE